MKLNAQRKSIVADGGKSPRRLIDACFLSPTLALRFGGQSPPR